MFGPYGWVFWLNRQKSSPEVGTKANFSYLEEGTSLKIGNLDPRPSSGRATPAAQAPFTKFLHRNQNSCYKIFVLC